MSTRDLQEALRDRRPIGQRLDGLRGVITRGETRITTKREALAAAQQALSEEEAEVEKHKEQLKVLEAELAAQTSSFQVVEEQTVLPWMEDTIMSLAVSIRRGTDKGGIPLSKEAIAEAMMRLVAEPEPELPEVPEDEDGDLVLDGAADHATADTNAPVTPINKQRRVRLASKTLVETPMLGQPGSVAVTA